jgi:type IV pilus assembly protein PilA
MTTLNSRLQLSILNRKKGRNLLEKGFTLVELMIVIVIVGILSAVALPNFLNQTKKAAATEASQQVSSIFRQAHTYVLQQGSLGTVSANCSNYAGTLTTEAQGANFSYACGGTQSVFTITATGKSGNNNTDKVTVTLTGDVGQGTVASINTVGA